MRDEVIKKVIKEVEVTDHFTIKCDCCNKEIFDKDHLEPFRRQPLTPT